jgi:hypothetical protein
LAHKLLADQSSPALHVSVSRVIPADPLTVYDALSDITTIGQRSPETHAAKWITPGKKFKGYNHIGPLYRSARSARSPTTRPGAPSPSMLCGHRRLRELRGATTSPP